MIKLTVNGQEHSWDGDPSLPLLWFLRDEVGLTGTKFGCGVGSCGACTALIDGKAVRTCVMPMSAVAGKSVRTIEGLSPVPGRLHPVQQAWIEFDVAQCGYCQAGQIMAAVDLLARTPNPTDADISSLTNICRCGTYPRIRQAIHRASELMRKQA
jgi:isoquinoline 1-oxidoreductase subunit alpha